MPRPIHARIHQAALRNNLSRVRRLAPGSHIWSVVKANAYGHGIARVFEALRSTDGFAPLDLDEALLLRELGWQGPILLIEGFFSMADLRLVDKHQLSSTVHNIEQLRMLETTALQHPLDVMLKINTGMNRLGFTAATYRDAWQRLRALPWIGSITHMSHFSDADGERGISHQMQAFDAITADLPGPASMANSAAILWHPSAHRQAARPGIMLYGASPSGRSSDIADAGLLPAMSLHSEIIATQEIDKDATVGYGSRYTASRKTRIGVIACGYADGYPREATGWGEQRSEVLVAGVRCPLAGRVSMDMMTIELPDGLDVHVGTPVTLWGDSLPIDEVAASAGRIGYELMCALAPRVPVEVLGA